jgi:hypothetical protein
MRAASSMKRIRELTGKVASIYLQPEPHHAGGKIRAVPAASGGTSRTSAQYIPVQIAKRTAKRVTDTGYPWRIY